MLDNLLSAVEGLCEVPGIPGLSGVVMRAVGAVGREFTGGDDGNKPLGIKEISDKVTELKSSTAGAVNAVLDLKGCGRLVVFVDDIDRLAPIDAVNLLEGIKNFAEWENCVFVLAVDREVINYGIDAKFGEKLGNERRKSFFDKIIQLPFSMPVQQYNIEGYVEGLLPDEMKDQAADYARVVENVLGSKNPRAIKRSFNLWELYKSVELDDSRHGEKPDVADAAMRDMFLFAIVLFKSLSHRDEGQSESAFESIANVARSHGGEVGNAECDDVALARDLCDHMYGKPAYDGLVTALDLPVKDLEDSSGPLGEKDARRLAVFGQVVDTTSRIFVSYDDAVSPDETGSENEERIGFDYRLLTKGAIGAMRLLLESRLEERPLSEKRIDYYSIGRERREICSVRPRQDEGIVNIVFYFPSDEVAKTRRDKARSILSEADGSGDMTVIYASSNRLKSGKSFYATLAGISHDVDSDVLSRTVCALLGDEV